MHREKTKYDKEEQGGEIGYEIIEEKRRENEMRVKINKRQLHSTLFMSNVKKMSSHKSNKIHI